MPRYNFEHPQAIINARSNLEYHIGKKNVLEQKYIRKNRTNAENRALHLYYKFVAIELVKIGFDHHETDYITGEIIEIPFTGPLFKDLIWRKLQITMFKITSTTKLKTHMINAILDVLSLWLGEKGIQVNFPNTMDMLIKQYEKMEQYGA